MGALAGYAVVETTDSIERATVVMAVLRGAGIPAQVEGGLLMDYFALTQQTLRLQGTEVLVPTDRLEEARAVLAEVRTPGEG
mgnify:CR=1 FL=1|tara:strand:- start:82 stop:327 length:246 start_codon:yes stop_codon:yes gene_type:complete